MREEVTEKPNKHPRLVPRPSLGDLQTFLDHLVALPSVDSKDFGKLLSLLFPLLLPPKPGAFFGQSDLGHDQFSPFMLQFRRKLMKKMLFISEVNID